MILTHDELALSIGRYIDRLDFPAEPARLYGPIRYALQEGGKRLRPVLTLAAANIFTPGVDDVLPVAAAVEVFHNFTLLHDDIMDNAEVRRGRMAVHRKWDGNTAILSGDVMMIYAYSLLEKCAPEVLGGIFAEFNLLAREVCEGQQLDMDFEAMETVAEEQYMKMIGLKTASLIAHAVHMGAMAGGAPRNGAAALYDFGAALGLAFQLRDDLLDTYGTTASLGKEVGGDIMEGKKTYLLIHAMRQEPERVRELLRMPMPCERKLEEARRLFDSLGVREMTVEAIERHTAQAVKALDAVDGDTSLLRTMACELIDRDK